MNTIILDYENLFLKWGIFMRRKKFIRGIVTFIAFFFLVAAGLFFTERNRDVIINYSNLENGERKALIEKVYDIKFPVVETPSKTIDLLLPIYKNCEIEEAQKIASLFGDFQLSEETEEYFEFEKGFKRVFVYKYISLIRYENHDFRVSFKKEIDRDEAVSLAWEFIADKMIYLDIADLNDREISVLSNEDGYSVSFIRNVNGYRNYAFPAMVSVDKEGNILSANLYYFEYEKIGSCRTKSINTAVLELPLDFPEYGSNECRVDLKSCQLVYFYENSIVQPAYMFLGEVIDEKMEFTCFVKAALYK